MIYNNLNELKEGNPNPTVGMCLYARHTKTRKIIPFIYIACPECNNCRWVSKWKMNRMEFTGRCVSCNGKINGKNNFNTTSDWSFIDADGYRRVRIFSDSQFYSMANSRRYILEHRLIMAKHLGRPLADNEIVHHKGIKYPQGTIENKQDNRIENLELIISLSEHGKMAYKELIELRDRVTQLEAEVSLLRAQLEKEGNNVI